MVIHIINGPNLNLVGLREPEVYGNRSLDQYLQELIERYTQHTIDVYQSNIEGEIVDRLQQVGFDDCGIILNAGGYTHTSVATSTRVSLSATSLCCLPSARASSPASASTATASPSSPSPPNNHKFFKQP